MTTIISGTNRNNSRTLQVAQFYSQILNQLQHPHHLVSLRNLDVYSRNEELKKLEKDIFIPSDRFIIIMPEYNGSFPGVLKALLDNSDIKQCWWHKKALLTGVADGRGGNLRGIEHMTNILHYLKMNVHYNKLPLSKINEEMDEAGNFIHDTTKRTIEEQIRSFIDY
jgi:chromate reductase